MCKISNNVFSEAADADMSPKELALVQALQSAVISQSSKNNNPRGLLTNCTYLEDTCVELFGLRVYGSPWYVRCLEMALWIVCLTF